MTPNPRSRLAVLLAGTLLHALCLLPDRLAAEEYFVSPAGDDNNDGRGSDSAFATIQHGVNALDPGDILTIAPGEYSGRVRREGIGGPDADTVIRAGIPGTVVLRGDKPIHQLRRLEGYRLIQNP